MTVVIDGKQIKFQILLESDLVNLLKYLNMLSDESKMRFGPHPFTHEQLSILHNNSDEFFMFISKLIQTDCVTSYCILKKGLIEYEFARLSSYGLKPSETDFTIAPSVADSWQGKGLGTVFLEYVLSYAKCNLGAKRFFLWGGVQKSNIKAIKLYQKFDFKMLGEFEYHGSNLDMILELKQQQ